MKHMAYAALHTKTACTATSVVLVGAL